MLIEDYDVEMATPECDLESSIYTARVTFESDASEVLPYLNSVVEKGEYLSGVPVLVWKEGSHKYALRPHEIAIGNVDDRGQGLALAGDIIRMINETWERRDTIQPRYESYEKPKVLDVFKLLPRTNCKVCGSATCMAFAAELCESKKELADCPPLLEADRGGDLQALETIMRGGQQPPGEDD